MRINQEIIQITEAAADHLKKIIEQSGDGNAIRLSIKKTGCSGYMYVPEVVQQQRAGDLKIANPYGFDIFLDAQCEKIIAGTVIDYVIKSLGVKQLEFINPNAVSLCGCGESFKLKGDEASE
jgi:iron-sulfur cluster assembly accessory protein